MSEVKRFVLHGAREKASARTAIDLCPEEEGKVWEVLLKKHVRNRSLAQQALMWIWHGQWSEHFGDSKNEEHIRFKAQYLLPMLLENPDIMPGIDYLYSRAQDAVQEDGNTGPLQALYRMISTKWLNTKQFAQLLTQYQQDAATQGCVFKTRGPQYDEAMGAKR